MLRRLKILLVCYLTLLVFSTHSYAYQWNDVEKFFRTMISSRDSRIDGTGTWFQLFDALGNSLPCGLGKSLSSYSTKYQLRFSHDQGLEPSGELVKIVFAEPDWMFQRNFNRVAILPLVSENWVRKILNDGGRIFLNGKWVFSGAANEENAFADITGDWKMSTKIDLASCSWVNGPSPVDVEWKESTHELKVRMHLQHYQSEGQHNWSTIYYYPGQMVIRFSENPFLLSDIDQIKKTFKKVTTDRWYVGVFNQQESPKELKED